jgi:hypothetical protein
MNCLMIHSHPISKVHVLRGCSASQACGGPGLFRGTVHSEGWLLRELLHGEEDVMLVLPALPLEWMLLIFHCCNNVFMF